MPSSILGLASLVLIGFGYWKVSSAEDWTRSVEIQPGFHRLERFQVLSRDHEIRAPLA